MNIIDRQSHYNSLFHCTGKYKLDGYKINTSGIRVNSSYSYWYDGVLIKHKSGRCFIGGFNVDVITVLQYNISGYPEQLYNVYKFYTDILDDVFCDPYIDWKGLGWPVNGILSISME